MRRISTGIALLILILSVALAGCTKAKPEAREPSSSEGTPTTETSQTVTVPTSQVGGDVLPTFTPTPKAPSTTIATKPTAAPEGGDVVAGAQASPTVPAPQGSPTPIPTMALPTPVPVLSPGAEPAPLLSPTPIPPLQPTPVPGGSDSYAPSGVTYVVRWGDTLISIAQEFGVTVQDIMVANNMSSDLIVIGQELIIPGAGPSPSPGTDTVVHIVQPGETLFSIAQRYNTTFQEIAQANGIANPWFIYAGQQLIIPSTGGVNPASPTTSYVVQQGDTLYLIAMRHNTTVQALMVANNLANPNFIYPGQVLVIR